MMGSKSTEEIEDGCPYSSYIILAKPNNQTHLNQPSPFNREPILLQASRPAKAMIYPVPPRNLTP